MIDIRRRGFLFGAAATLVIAPRRTIYIPKPPGLIVAPVRPAFDLPARQMLALQMRLARQELPAGHIPRWVWLNPAQYEALTGQRAAT